MDKAQKYVLGSLAVLCVFMFLMLFFEVKGVIQVTEAATSTASQLNEAGDKLVRISESMDRRTKMEALLYEQVYGGNYSLELTAS